MALKHLPESFNVDSEEELRFAVAKYFHELGFEPDELSFEDQFQIKLGHNTLIVNGKNYQEHHQVRGRSDLLLMRNGTPIAIVETKAPTHTLTEEDSWQAISYARLLLKMAPYAIVTNGRETRVHDVFSDILTPLESPTDSQWHKNGQHIPSIGEDLKTQAAQILIGLNPQTLKSFCYKQVTQALEDLEGTIHESAIYVADLYLPRQDIASAFNDWLASDLPCFAIVGESGVGKTNSMCATAEGLLEREFVLFYPAARLTGGILAAIQNDFLWEFQRERSPAHIVERLDAIAGKHNQKFVIFIDSLDEYIGQRDHLKEELRDLVYRLREKRSVKLCLSCKAFDWKDFVLDNGRTYNRLAKSIYPPREEVHNPQQKNEPNPNKEVGIWLEKFMDDELNAVFPKYERLFSLKGELRGNARIECQMPLILRFVAEVYHSRNVDLPSEILARDLFDLYWDRRLSQIKHRNFAEQLLAELAKLSIELNERHIEFSLLRERLIWTDYMEAAYQAAVRLGLIRITIDSNKFTRLTFGLEKIRSYIYTVRAAKWPNHPPDKTARMMCALLTNPLAVEAVEFYLNTIDRGETGVLTEIARLNFNCFLQLTNYLELKSSIVQDVSEEQRQQALINRFEQYALSYSVISRRYFPELCEKIAPYTTGDVGVWVHGSMYQLRTRTETLPQTVVIPSPEIVASLWNRNAPLKVYEELRPAGTLYGSMDDIAEHFPQKLAWERIRSEIAEFVEKRFLDESSSSDLLQERIWDTLLYSPNLWFEECPPPYEKFWRLLEFENVQDIEAITIRELLARVHSLIQGYAKHIPQNIDLREMGMYSKWCVSQVKDLRRVYYWLELLQPLCQQLRQPKFKAEDLFKYLHTKDLNSVVETVQSLMSGILEAYRSLATQNFSQILDWLEFFRFSDSSIVVEVTHNPYGGYYTDYLTLCYIVLPSVKLHEKYLVYTCEGKDSIVHTPLVRQTLKGTITSYGGEFGHANISLNLDGNFINEPNAILCFTKYPSRQPILDQAYQLLAREVQYFLSGSSGDWWHVEHRRTDKDELDRWIDRYYLRQQTQNSVPKEDPGVT